MAKKKQKGTNGYVTELNKLVRAEYNGEIPAFATIGDVSIQPLHLSFSLPGSTQFIKGNLCTQLVSHLSQGWEKGSGKEIKSCTFSKPDAATFEVKVTITSINEDRGI